MWQLPSLFTLTQSNEPRKRIRRDLQFSFCPLGNIVAYVLEYEILRLLLDEAIFEMAGRFRLTKAEIAVNLSGYDLI